jgi:hypothetical protein
LVCTLKRYTLTLYAKRRKEANIANDNLASTALRCDGIHLGRQAGDEDREQIIRGGMVA